MATASDPTLALVDGRVVKGSDLHEIMIELAGAETLAEVVLDLRLHAEARSLGIEVDASAIDRERELLLQTLSDDRDRAVLLLRDLRRRQGLGPVRFEAMLRRNALLRKSIAREVEVTERDARAAYELAYGERRQARIIVVGSAAEAQRITERLAAGEPFIDLAIEASTDPSAARGGLLAPISRADPTYPAAIRDTLSSLAPGETSSAVMIEGGFALLRLEEVIPASSISFEEASDRMFEVARRNQERVLMEQKARELLESADVMILDAALDREWHERRE